MGEVEIFSEEKRIVIRATIICYGNAANKELASQIAFDIRDQWNEVDVSVRIKKQWMDVVFEIDGMFRTDLTTEEVIENVDPRFNYFRIEDYAHGNISYVDGIGSNTGYFLKENLLNRSTTAAHEFGHTIGLHHPTDLDIRGLGTPGIMYPRGTLTDPEFQYDPAAQAGAKGGSLNPFTRKVLPKDIKLLMLDKLDFKNNIAVIGEFTSVWHDAEMP